MRHSLRDVNEQLLRQSDAVYDIAYDDATRELHVWWWRPSKSDPENAKNPRRGTDHYVYYDVPWSVWDGLCNEKHSLGSEVNITRWSEKYNYRRVYDAE